MDFDQRTPREDDRLLAVNPVCRQWMRAELLKWRPRRALTGFMNLILFMFPLMDMILRDSGKAYADRPCCTCIQKTLGMYIKPFQIRVKKGKLKRSQLPQRVEPCYSNAKQCSAKKWGPNKHGRKWTMKLPCSCHKFAGSVPKEEEYDLGELDIEQTGYGNPLKKVFNHVKKAVGGAANHGIKMLIGTIFKGNFAFLKAPVERIILKKDFKGGLNELLKAVVHKFLKGQWAKLRKAVTKILVYRDFKGGLKELFRRPAIEIIFGFMNKLVTKQLMMMGKLPRDWLQCKINGYINQLKYPMTVHFGAEGWETDGINPAMPLDLTFRRYGMDRQLAKPGQLDKPNAKPECIMRFKYDLLMCTSWKEGRACQGTLVDKPVTAQLALSKAKNPEGNCEAWFAFMDGMVRSWGSGISSMVSTQHYSQVAVQRSAEWSKNDKGQFCLHAKGSKYGYEYEAKKYKGKLLQSYRRRSMCTVRGMVPDWESKNQTV